MDYTVIIHDAEEGGYWIEVPALPGCFSQGESMEEALQNIQEAIAVHLDALAEEGKSAPPDIGWMVARVAVPKIQAQPTATRKRAHKV
ncbi:MAG: type II toxin-antitoxin system HicB family antitoxin [Armatimonadota bacterium]